MNGNMNSIVRRSSVRGQISASLESVRTRWMLGYRAGYSLLGLASLSYIAWLLFAAAQSTSKAGPADHRDMDSWLACTGLFLFAWLISTILEYRLERNLKIRVKK